MQWRALVGGAVSAVGLSATLTYLARRVRTWLEQLPQYDSPQG